MLLKLVKQYTKSKLKILFSNTTTDSKQSNIRVTQKHLHKQNHKPYKENLSSKQY